MTYVTDPYRFGGGDSLLTDLIAWWSLDETSGNRADSHTGAKTLTEYGTMGYTTGVVSNCITNNGTNTKVLYRNADTDLTPTGDWSISAWCDPNVANGVVAAISHTDGTTRSFQLAYILAAFHPQSVNGLVFLFDNGTTLYTVGDSGDGGTAAWHHVVAWYDSSAGKICIRVDDGTTRETASVTGNMRSAAEEFNIGGRGGGAGNPGLPISGEIDEVAIWGRVLTASEITRLYNSGSGMGYPG